MDAERTQATMTPETAKAKRTQASAPKVNGIFGRDGVS